MTFVQIFVGENGKKRAQIYFGGNIDSGKVTYEGKEYPRRIQLRKFDEKAARSAGTLCAKDCFDESYRYDWYDDETDNWWNYQCQYKSRGYLSRQKGYNQDKVDQKRADNDERFKFFHQNSPLRGHDCSFSLG